MSENQGFKNTNNRCFAIVAVQMIFSDVDLVNFIQDAKPAKIVKKGPITGTEEADNFNINIRRRSWNYFKNTFKRKIY
jgi:hypothetical protein